jgi:hypothetical protein
VRPPGLFAGRRVTLTPPYVSASLAVGHASSGVPVSYQPASNGGAGCYAEADYPDARSGGAKNEHGARSADREHRCPQPARCRSPQLLTARHFFAACELAEEGQHRC